MVCLVGVGTGQRPRSLAGLGTTWAGQYGMSADRLFKAILWPQHEFSIYSKESTSLLSFENISLSMFSATSWHPMNSPLIPSYWCVYHNFKFFRHWRAEPSLQLNKGPPYLPRTWGIGGIPKVVPDVPVTAVFLLLYIVAAIAHVRIEIAHVLSSVSK
jgi:hypothetical protein